MTNQELVNEARAELTGRTQTQAGLIRKILDIHFLPGVGNGMLPVVFIGQSGPVFIGYSFDLRGVDALLFTERLSAERVSRAMLNGDVRSFFVALV